MTPRDKSLQPMRYLIANLTLMVVICAALTASVAIFFAPRWWAYLGLVPAFFFVAGYLEERVFSGFVNRFVDTIWRKCKCRNLSDIRAFTVHDDVRLLDLLNLEREMVERSDWNCHHVDAISPDQSNINTSGLPNDRRSMSGGELLRLAARVEQLLGGDFSGYVAGAEDPWLKIRSIRGMYFVVITSSDSLVAALRIRCRDVRESPEDVG